MDDISTLEMTNPIDSGRKEIALETGRVEPQLPTVPLWRLVTLGISLCVGLFLSLLDTTIIATALFTIGVEFDSLTTVTWVALAYTLSYLGCVVIFARMGDIVGRKNAYISAFIIFFASSIGCGFSRSFGALVGCRALQGLGGSGLYSLSVVIFPEITPNHLKKWIGTIIGVVLAIAGVLGPLFGGIITHYTTWRWVFWINPLIGILPLIMFWFTWPKADQMRHVERRSIREMDFVSGVLLIAASVLVVFSLQESGIKTNSWASAIFLTPLIIGCFCWILLFAWEWTVDRLWGNMLSMLPLRVLRCRVYLLAALSTLLTGFPYFAILYSLPLRFQVVNNMTPLAAGLGLLPMVGSAAIGSVIAGMLLGTKNRTFPILVIASCLMVIGTSCLSTLSITIDIEAKAYGFQIFMGLGFGLTVATSSILAGIECELRDHAVAQGIVAQARVLGGSIGIAASTAILGVMEYDQLPGVVSESQLASLQTSEQELSPAQLHAIRQAYSDAFNEDMRVCAIVAGICVLLTIGTFQRNPLDIPERRKQQVINEQKRLRSTPAVGGK